MDRAHRTWTATGCAAAVGAVVAGGVALLDRPDAGGWGTVAACCFGIAVTCFTEGDWLGRLFFRERRERRGDSDQDAAWDELMDDDCCEPLDEKCCADRCESCCENCGEDEHVEWEKGKGEAGPRLRTVLQVLRRAVVGLVFLLGCLTALGLVLQALGMN
ncbi:hypothetical protein OG455_05570 [Kitasatospora sp. NBC_01287]|uniref:hypothetical protein n=1 Tax=Kitasatospora sp. NBC_01287 TaxID=2903573 RepID=UPI00224E7D55|nr:hypothetical protein [Kitasatospora sp. NBC_01287]MCX4744997.1 hypothetical protein [Kitasatospora sp. NBC_01287]